MVENEKGKVEISVSLWVSATYQIDTKHNYDVSLRVTPKGKRKDFHVSGNECAEWITQEQIQQAKLELWESMKPA